MENIMKVELHLHLDGSLRVETILDLGIKKGILDKDTSIEDVKKIASILPTDVTLVDYLKKFDMPVAILQDKSSLERVSFELIEDLAIENTIYTEIRIAPIQHIKEGLTPEEVVEAILKGINKAKEKYNIEANLLLCAMRHLPPLDNNFLIPLAKKYKNEGVVGLDLAGDEAGYPVTIFKDFFLEAKANKIPFTIHAGEASGTKSIIDAINLGAKRLGHGIRAFEDKKALELIKKENICLECCPKSNFDTHAIEDFSKYPIKDYLNSGIAATLNSDNRTVSDTKIDNEVDFLNKYIELTKEDIYQLNLNALNSAFIPKETKDKLIVKLKGELNGIK